MKTQTIMEMPSDAKDIVIVGDGMCGKTSVINVFLRQHFPNVYMPTVYENHTCFVNIEGKEVRLSMWDTAVQEDFEIFRPLLYRKASVFIVMYSVDRPESLDNVYEKWVPEVREHCPNAPIILVACKIDLRDKPTVIGEDDRVPISSSRGKRMARKINALAYRECSALTNKGIREVFQTAVYNTRDEKQKRLSQLTWFTSAWSDTQ